MKQIAIYGKGGIGKSTVAANLSAALAVRGRRVLQIGCDPKHDSTRTLLNGKSITTVLDLMNARKSDALSVEEILLQGFGGVGCIEAGGPEPGVGCAGRGIILAIDCMQKLGIYRRDFDYIFYDVLGDIVCGGFAVPIREGYAEEVLLVVSGEFMSLYAANNICRAIERYAQRSGTRLRGIVANLKGLPGEEDCVRRFARKIRSLVIGVVLRDPLIPEAESQRQTVVQRFPDAPISRTFFSLAAQIEARGKPAVPRSLGDDELGALVFAAGSP